MAAMRSALTMIVAFALVACGKAPAEPEWPSAEATVFRIDRLCTSNYIVGEVGQPDEQVTNTRDCQMGPAFLKAASQQAGRADYVRAIATVKVTYVAPQDRAQRTGQVTFNGADDQFYSLKAGDTLPILVSPTDPENIRFDRSA